MLRKYSPILFFFIIFSLSMGTAHANILADILGWGFSQIVSLITSIFSAIINVILNFLISGLEILRNFVGWLVTVSIYYTVVVFKDSFVNLANVSGQGVGQQNLIYFLWGIIRDIFNTVIFFLVVYHALRSMFDGFDASRPKFIGLLVFSLFINFSLLFVKFAVDLSNIFTLQMYSLSVAPAGSASFSEFTARGPNPNKAPDLASFLSKQLNDIKLYEADGQTEINTGYASFSANAVIYNIIKIIILLFTILVLAYITWIFIYRAVVFVMAMILSPFITADFFFNKFGGQGAPTSLLGAIKPLTEEIMKRFKDELLKTPLLMLLIFLTGVFTTAIFSTSFIKGLTVSANANNAVTGALVATAGILPQGFLFTATDLIIRFAILCAFAAFGMKILTNSSSWTSGLGGGVFRWGLKNTAGAFGRQVIGRGIGAPLTAYLGRRQAAIAERLKDGSLSPASRFALQTRQSLLNLGIKRSAAIRDSSYDPLNVNKNSLGGRLLGAAGVDVAALNKLGVAGGYRKLEADRREKREREEKKITDLVSGEVVANKDQIDEAKAKQTGIFAGREYSHSDLEKMLAEVETPTKTTEIKNAIKNGGSVNINGVSFSDKDQLTKLLDKNGPDGLRSSLTIATSEAEAKASKEAKKKYEQARARQIASGNARKISDYIPGTNAQAIQNLEKEGRKEIAGKNAGETKERAKNSSIVVDTWKSLEKTRSQLNDLINSGTLDESQKREAQEKLGFVMANMALMESKAVKIEESDDSVTKANKLKKFGDDKKLRDDILSSKYAAADFLEDIHTNEEVGKELGRKVSRLDSAIENAINPLDKKAIMQDITRLKTLKLRDPKNTTLDIEIGKLESAIRGKVEISPEELELKIDERNTFKSVLGKRKNNLDEARRISEKTKSLSEAYAKAFEAQPPAKDEKDKTVKDTKPPAEKAPDKPPETKK